jgi:uncharacterized protein YjbJ (UPF0337 family)
VAGRGSPLRRAPARLRQATVWRTSMSEKAKGKMKEATGAMTGDEAKKAEGRAEQTKAEAAEEAKQREKTRQAEAEAKAAEKDRDKQRRKDKGVLGGITDTLTGR